MARKKNKKKNIKIKDYMNIFLCIFIVSLLLVLSIFIYESNILTPRIDELTTSYISFNNLDTTDIIKFNNIEKMSNEKGISKKNKNCKKIKISGKKKYEYKIVTYPINNTIEYKYIYFNISKSNKTNTLDEFEQTEDRGREVYKGKIDNDNEIELCMWVSDKYKKAVKNISFEIKIK